MFRSILTICALCVLTACPKDKKKGPDVGSSATPPAPTTTHMEVGSVAAGLTVDTDEVEVSVGESFTVLVTVATNIVDPKLESVQLDLYVETDPAISDLTADKVELVDALTDYQFNIKSYSWVADARNQVEQQRLTFTCLSETELSETIAIDVAWQVGGLTVDAEDWYIQVRCTAPTPTRKEPAVQVANVREVTRSAVAWGTVGASFGIFNAILRSAALDAAHYEPAPLEPDCELFRGVPTTAWTSEQGPDQIRFTSGTQTATADWSGDRYAWNGLVNDAAFVNLWETVSFAWDDAAGVEQTLEVEPPPIEEYNANSFFSVPAGYDTIFQTYDGSGETNVFHIFATVDDGDPTTQSGFTCVFPQASVPYGLPLVPTGLRDFVTVEHDGIEDLYIGAYREEVVVGMFGEPVRVQAGHAFYVHGNLLNP